MRWDRISLLVDRMKEDLESYGFVYLLYATSWEC